MKKLLILLLLPLFLGSTSKYEYKFEAEFAPFIFAGINDSIPTIDQFGRVRNGIIVQGIVDVLNTDPSGVDLTEIEIAYIRSIVGGMYLAGSWQKCNAVYLFVGGNAWKHKWNAKDMRDLDAAYRLNFLGGGWVHNSNGSKPNGTSSYADTYFVQTYDGSGIAPDFHISYCTNENTANISNESAIGDRISGSQTRLIIKRSNGSGFALITNTSSVTGKQYMMPSDIRGLSIANKLGTNVSYILNGTILIGTDVAQSVGFIVPPSIKIGGVESSQFTDKRCSFASIGEGLTDTEAIQMSNIVTFAQGILSRQ